MIKNLDKDQYFIVILTGYVFLMLFFCSKMSPFYATNEWADPNIYFNVAKGMMNGKILYTEIFDHKGPFIFFIYGLGYLISNSSFFGVFFIEVIGWLALSYSIYFTSRFYLEKQGSLLVSIIFLIFLVKLMKAGGSAEEFILIWESISMYLFIKFFKDKSPTVHNPWYMFIHGALCSMVLFTKLNLIMFWFFPLLGIFLTILINKKYKNLILNGLAFIGGSLLIAIPIILYLYTNNALEEAYNVYIVLNKKYAEINSIKTILLNLISRIFYLYLEPISLFIMPLIGVFYFPFKFIPNKIGKWSMVLAGIMTYTVIFMAPMFQYYYPIPFIVFDILGLIGLALFFKKYISFDYSFPLLATAVVIIFYIGLSQKPLSNTWVEYTFLKSKKFYSPKYLSEDLIDKIKEENTDKEITLLNLGFGLGNSLFTTLNIVPNVKYFVKPNLANRIYPELREQQTQYIKDKKVEFIVLQHYLTKKKHTLREKGDSDDYSYYKNLPVLKKNYNLILVDSIKNRIDENAFEIYYLYKRNDSIK